MSPDDLRARGEQVVDRLLRENENRWRSLQPADRRRVEALAREVAARLLEEPTRRLGAADAQTVDDLFGLGQAARSASPAGRDRTRVRA
jgi:glutamyl-tRNA reductase